jgi:hypothetical protein
MGNTYGNYREENEKHKNNEKHNFMTNQEKDMNNYNTVDRSHPVNDEQAIMKQSLKVLFKNNFVSLTFVQKKLYNLN